MGWIKYPVCEKCSVDISQGPDWCYTEENLRKVRIGVVIRKSRSEKKVMVSVSLSQD